MVVRSPAHALPCLVWGHWHKNGPDLLPIGGGGRYCVAARDIGVFEWPNLHRELMLNARKTSRRMRLNEISATEGEGTMSENGRIFVDLGRF